ncbi:hypothetical protein TNCV_464971 [Trichonephila clavipes]|nr:hypothetical protein TNCV_464971 [Trichonephila clavipes]
MLNRRSNQQPWQCRCSSDAGVYREKKRKSLITDELQTSLAVWPHIRNFLCAVHLRERRSDGRSPVPKLELQFLYLPCLQETEFGGMCFSYPTSEGELLAKGTTFPRLEGALHP